jgi:hypothetical protein
MLYRFRISIHARPPGEIASRSIRLDGMEVQMLQLEPAQRTRPLRVSFEEAVECLEQLPRMFVEPDGSFVWVGQRDASTWQLDGCLYDRDQHIIYVDVAGTCPLQQFDQLLSAFGWPDAPLIFQVVQQAVFLGEHDFRNFVGGAS